MDQYQAPILDALAEHHRRGRYGFAPPGHRQGRGADKTVSAGLTLSGPVEMVPAGERSNPADPSMETIRVVQR